MPVTIWLHVVVRIYRSYQVAEPVCGFSEVSRVMRKNQVKLTIVVMMLLFGVVGLFGQTSSWVSFGDDHRLHYQQDVNGNRIMDFSSAGYKGGGVALPTGVPVRATVSPSGGDDTAA